MLLKVVGSDHWYANFVNFMVQVMYHQGRISGSSSMKVTSTYGMNCTFTESAPMDCSGGVFRLRKQPRSLKDATYHYMEDIMGHSTLMLRSGRNQRLHTKVHPVSETWEYQCKIRHATHHQPPVRTL
jgi:hypothetical protein